MRRIIKRLLKKYDYPPKQAREALEVVMKQAELMCENTKPRDVYLESIAEEDGDYIF